MDRTLNRLLNVFVLSVVVVVIAGLLDVQKFSGADLAVFVGLAAAALSGVGVVWRSLWRQKPLLD